MKNEHMLDELQYRLDLVNRWLEFAEKKNAALFVANIAIMAALFKAHSLNFTSKIDFYLIILALNVTFSTLCCIISFIPQIKLVRLYLTAEVKTEDNLLFFRHIAKYNPQKYIIRLYNEADKPFQKLAIEEDYVEQLIINSRIALKKFELFNLGIWFILAAIFTPLVFLFFKREAD